MADQTETDELRDALYAIVNELNGLFLWWKVSKELFWNSPWRAAFLDSVSKNTFSIFEGVLMDNIVLTFAKLTDPPKSSGIENLSFERICTMVERKDKQLSEELGASLEKIKKYCKCARDHRHKRLAHFDYKVQMDLDFLPRYPVHDFVRAMEEINRFIVLAAGSVDKFRFEFEPETWDSITDGFVECLKQGMRYRELRDAGKIDPEDMKLFRYNKV